MRRLRRRNIRRRFLIFGLPALFISVLAGTYFLNANAASSIQYSFQLDLSELDANFINESETIFSRQSDNPFTYEADPAPYFIAAGISVVVIVSFIAVYIYEKNKRKKNKK